MDERVYYSINRAEVTAKKMEENVPTGSSQGDITFRPDNFRSSLAQYLATCVNSLSYMVMGLMFTMPAVVIGNIGNVQDDAVGLSLDESQASWYGTLLPIFQPFGSIIGGFVQNYMGRKRGLLLTNVLTVTTWLMLYKATNLRLLFASSILMGINIGLTEAACISYVCEIATPKLRGTLVGYNNANLMCGMLLTFLLTTIVSWRTVALVSSGLSILCVLLRFFIPDSPVWLINKGRNKEAIVALRWLRGWVSETEVQAEFEELGLFIKRSYSNNSVNERTDGSLSQKQKLAMNDFLDKATLRPFIFLIFYVFFTYAAASQGTTTCSIVIYAQLNLNMDPNWMAFLVSLSSFIGAVACATTVKMYGKRPLSLISMVTSSILSMSLGVYMSLAQEAQHRTILVVLFLLLGFTQMGILTYPWILMGELFPIKTKFVAAGITNATFYILVALYNKTFYSLRLLMNTGGAYILYGTLGIIGFFYLWVFMPETEGKTMAEIQELFEDDARRSCPHYLKKRELKISNK